MRWGLRCWERSEQCLIRTVGVYSHRQSSSAIYAADGLKPIRTVAVMMLGAKRAVFVPYGGGYDAGSEASSVYSHRNNQTRCYSRQSWGMPLPDINLTKEPSLFMTVLSMCSGWGQRSRTSTYRFRVCCPAIRRAPTNECLSYHIPAFSYKGSSRNSLSWLRILIFSTKPIPSSIETSELPP